MEERGIVAWNAQNIVADDDVIDEEMGVEGAEGGDGQRKTKHGLEVYDFPFGMELLKR